MIANAALLCSLARAADDALPAKAAEALRKATAFFSTEVACEGGYLSNKPLYFTRAYELRYDDADMPTHYALKVESRLDSIEREYRRSSARDPKEVGREAPERPDPLSAAEIARARKVVDALDPRGRWVEEGRLRYHGDADPTRRVIRCDTFIENVGALSRYLAAVKRARQA